MMSKSEMIIIEKIKPWVEEIVEKKVIVAEKDCYQIS
jgi:hypothetical protein